MKYAHHKYTFDPAFGSDRHNWQLVGEKGGLNFHVSILENKQYGPSAGLEFHSFAGKGSPSHTPCWLLGGPCWHDGTSSYAMDTLWPVIEPMLAAGEHRTIFRVLESEADRYFERTDES